MIEVRHMGTALCGVKTVGGGLYPKQIAKRKKQATQEKRVCKGKGCITKIVPYNRDRKGNLETLCYNCRSKAGEGTTTPEVHLYDPEDVDRKVCAGGHDMDEVGRAVNGRCGECHREDERTRNKAKAIAAGRPYVEHNSRVGLYRLAEFMEKHEVTLNGLARKIDTPVATLRGWVRMGMPGYEGYTCPPERAEIIAETLGVTVAELTGEEEE